MYTKNVSCCLTMKPFSEKLGRIQYQSPFRESIENTVATVHHNETFMAGPVP